MVAEQRVRGLPADAFGQCLRGRRAGGLVSLLAAEERQHGLLRGAAGERGCEQPDLLGDGDARLGAAEQPGATRLAALFGLRRELFEQATAVGRRQAVAHGYQGWV